MTKHPMSRAEFAKGFAAYLMERSDGSVWDRVQAAIDDAKLRGSDDVEMFYREVMLHLDPRAVRDKEPPQFRF